VNINNLARSIVFSCARGSGSGAAVGLRRA